jgi:hypothetical protein
MGGLAAEDPQSELRKEIEDVLQRLRSVEGLAGEELPAAGDVMVVLARGIRLALEAAGATLGECRLELPYAPIQPIRDDSGLKWCCTHNPPHC